LFHNSSLFSYVFVLSLQQDVSASRPYVTDDVASPLYKSNFEIPTYVECQCTLFQFLCLFVETSPFCVCLSCRLQSASRSLQRQCTRVLPEKKRVHFENGPSLSPGSCLC
jgi:hypothetical protein